LGFIGVGFVPELWRFFEGFSDFFFFNVSGSPDFPKKKIPGIPSFMDTPYFTIGLAI
jgi:hypothetical protein